MLYQKKTFALIQSSYHAQRMRIVRNGDVRKELDTEKVASNSVQLQMQKLLVSEHAFATGKAELSGKALFITTTSIRLHVLFNCSNSLSSSK